MVIHTDEEYHEALAEVTEPAPGPLPPARCEALLTAIEAYDLQRGRDPEPQVALQQDLTEIHYPDPAALAAQLYRDA